MRGEKLRPNLPLFWNNDGKDRPKGQICPLAKKEVFFTTSPVTIDRRVPAYFLLTSYRLPTDFPDFTRFA